MKGTKVGLCHIVVKVDHVHHLLRVGYVSETPLGDMLDPEYVLIRKRSPGKDCQRSELKHTDMLFSHR